MTKKEEQEETTIQCPNNCGRTIYQSELCVCQQDLSMNKPSKHSYDNWCPDCNNAGYTTNNNKTEPCLNQWHNQ